MSYKGDTIFATVETLNTLYDDFDTFAKMYEKVRGYWRSLNNSFNRNIH